MRHCLIAQDGLTRSAFALSKCIVRDVLRVATNGVWPALSNDNASWRGSEGWLLEDEARHQGCQAASGGDRSWMLDQLINWSWPIGLLCRIAPPRRS